MAASLAKPFFGSPYASDGSLRSPSVPPSQNLLLPVPARRSQLKRLDATHDFKYGWRSIQDGGTSSARKTVGRVAAGAVAKKILEQYAGTEWRQNTLSRDEHEMELRAQGHHNPCVVPRAIPMVEAMVALVVLDQLMHNVFSRGVR